MAKIRLWVAFWCLEWQRHVCALFGHTTDARVWFKCGRCGVEDRVLYEEVWQDLGGPEPDPQLAERARAAVQQDIDRLLYHDPQPPTTYYMGVQPGGGQPLVLPVNPDHWRGVHGRVS